MKKLSFLFLVGTLVFGSACLKSDVDDLERIPQTLTTIPRLSIFTDALNRSSTAAALDGISPFTVFAPTDEAFQAFFSENGFSSLDDIPESTLKLVIDYHIVPGKASASNIFADYYTSISAVTPDRFPLSLLIEPDGGRLTFNGSAQSVGTEVEARNGFIYSLDEVLFPPTLMDMLEDNSAFSILEKALERTGISDTLNIGDDYTLLAPPDGAFESLFESIDGVDDLDDLATVELIPLIRYHLIPGLEVLQTNDFGLGTGTTYPTLEPNNSVVISIFPGAQGNDGFAVNDSARLLLVNIQAVDGAAHFVDRVIVPNP